MKCSKCSIPAVTHIRYNGSHLCSEHFQEYVEKRVKRDIRGQLDLRKGKHVAVAVSGGKDSQVAMFLLAETLLARRDVEISAITIDEGIAGYRERTIPKVMELAGALGIDHHLITFNEICDLDLDEMVGKVGEDNACTYCGVFRRRCLNLSAKAIGADVLALGHNLDDMAQSIMMNFTRGDVERLARLGPHDKVQEGLIPRIQPLRSIPEKETYLYALLRDLPFSDHVCPYAKAALRNEYRDMVDGLESRHPGTKHSILSSYDQLRPLLQKGFPQARLRECECGEPTMNERCMACEMMKRLKGV